MALDAVRQSERARYYSSNDARFLTPDPSGLMYAQLTNPQSLNLYNYVGNDPLSRVDLMGLCWKGFGWACDLWHATTSFVSHTIFHRHYTGRVYDINYILHVHAAQSSAQSEVSNVLKAFAGNGPKNIEYGPENPFTLSFEKSAGMDAINAKITANCSATSGRFYKRGCQEKTLRLIRQGKIFF